MVSCLSYYSLLINLKKKKTTNNFDMVNLFFYPLGSLIRSYLELLEQCTVIPGQDKGSSREKQIWRHENENCFIKKRICLSLKGNCMPLFFPLFALQQWHHPTYLYSFVLFFSFLIKVVYPNNQFCKIRFRKWLVILRCEWMKSSFIVSLRKSVIEVREKKISC